MGKFRHERLERNLAEAISAMLLRDEIRDPRVSSLLSVTNVKLTKDLSQATVQVSGFVAANQLEQAVDALNHAAGFIQGKIGQKIQTRTTPKLQFRLDTSIKEGFEVIQQMKGLH